MSNIQIFSKDIIPVYTTDEGNKVVMGRELHEKLGIKTVYADWFKRMCEYGFADGTDYSLVSQKCETNNPKNPYTTRTDHIMTLDMAKHIAMIQRTPQGMAIRQKLIELEKETTQQIMAPMSKELQAIFVLDNRTVQLDQRVTALENNAVIDYGQQQTLKNAVNHRVVTEVLGGKDSPAYEDTHVRGMVYCELNKDLQNWFRVSARNNIPRKRFDEAIEYVNRWKPSTNTAMMIQNINGQTKMFA